MASAGRFAATAVTLLAVLALAPAASALHDHDHGADARAAGHADCEACHLRHVTAVEAAGAPSAPAPDLVADTIGPAPPEGERTTCTGIRPSRGPPA